MRKPAAFGLAVCGMLLLMLLIAGIKLIYIHYHRQTLSDIAGNGAHTSLILTENNVQLRTVTDGKEIAAILDVLDDYIYTEYPNLVHPRPHEINTNRLIVTFKNRHSIGVSANGFVFVNGNLRDVEESRGQELYHKLYLLFYPNAA